MNKLRCIIVDDEEASRDNLKLMLQTFCSDIELQAMASNVPDAVIAINQHRPDLVFLDIEMPEYNGFELLNFFREIDFQLIFVTAYNEYALRAFEVSAVDYLLKPIDIDKLKQAVEKARLNKSNELLKEQFTLLKENYKSEQFNKIALPVSEGLIFVGVNDITYLEADGAYTHVWLSNKTQIFVAKKIKFFEEVLKNKPNFFRSHRSYIVNINYIQKYNRGDGSLLLDNGKTIYVARDRKSDFEEQLKEHNLTVR